MINHLSMFNSIKQQQTFL